MNADKKYKVLKVKDHTDSYTVNVDRLFNLPFRMLICARSGHGKSNLLTNILVNEQFGYTNLFDGDDIHIFSPTIKQDAKMQIIINYYDIEDENLHTEYSDELILSIYETMIEDFEEDIRKKENHLRNYLSLMTCLVVVRFKIEITLYQSCSVTRENLMLI